MASICRGCCFVLSLDAQSYQCRAYLTLPTFLTWFKIQVTSYSPVLPEFQSAVGCLFHASALFSGWSASFFGMHHGVVEAVDRCKHSVWQYTAVAQSKLYDIPWTCKVSTTIFFTYLLVGAELYRNLNFLLSMAYENVVAAIWVCRTVTMSNVLGPSEFPDRAIMNGVTFVLSCIWALYAYVNGYMYKSQSLWCLATGCRSLLIITFLNRSFSLFAGWWYAKLVRCFMQEKSNSAWNPSPVN